MDQGMTKGDETPRDQGESDHASVSLENAASAPRYARAFLLLGGFAARARQQCPFDSSLRHALCADTFWSGTGISLRPWESGAGSCSPLSERSASFRLGQRQDLQER